MNNNRFFTRTSLVALALCVFASCIPESVAMHDEERVERLSDVLVHTIPMIDGTPRDLADYRGKVVLIVNVASRCGLTPQYEGLQRLYEAHREEGLVVLGFPANNFMNQEPGTNEEIVEFCEANYGVTFPMFAKITVKGEDMHPLYRQLTSQPEPIGGEVQWNFQKYLVNRQGRVVAKFGPRVRPDDPALVSNVQELLSAS